MGYGKVCDNKALIINSISNCLNFILLVKDGLIVKYHQAIAFEKFLMTNNINIRKELYLLTNEEKHKIEIFNELNQNINGKNGFNEMLNLKEIKNKICKEIELKQVYKEKSESMKGENNHNYGKVFSIETRKKMSDSIRDSKNGISDDTILEIRRLINEGKTNKEIGSILNISMHNITRVKNGILVCRTEKKEEKEKLTQEQQNINRRKITLEELFIVIDKTLDNVKPGEILNILDENRLKNKVKNNLTINIIKNIRRNLFENKLPFYKCEVNNEKYELYKNKIEQYYLNKNNSE